MTTPRRSRVDLHCHTSRSDGVLAPRELYAAMAAYGMELVAITDHDTLAGVRELLDLGLGRDASAAGPRLVPGVEINTLAGSRDDVRAGRDDSELHILGLGVDPTDTTLEAALARQREGRRERFRRTVALLREAGIDVEPFLVADASSDVGADARSDTGALSNPGAGARSDDALGRPHVARALIAAGRATSVEDAFARYLSPGRPAYVRRVGLGPADAIAAIVAAGGIAVLAHAPDVPDRPWVLDRLMAAGLGGLEVHYPTFDEATVERMEALAGARGLLATGGSDYHGDAMDYATAQARSFVPDAVGEALLAALATLAARSTPARSTRAPARPSAPVA